MQRVDLILDSFDAARAKELAERLSVLSKKPIYEVEMALSRLPMKLATGLDSGQAKRFSEFLEEAGAVTRIVSDEPATESGGSRKGAGGRLMELIPPMRLRRKFGFAWEMFKAYGLRLGLFFLLGGIITSLLSALIMGVSTLGSGVAGTSPALGEFSPAQPFTALLMMFARSSGGMVASLLGVFTLIALWTHWIQLIIARLPHEHLLNAGKARIRRIAARTFPHIVSAAIAFAAVTLVQILLTGGAELLARFVPMPDMAVAGVALVSVLLYLILFVALIFYSPVIAIEGLGPMAALRRSWLLSKGFRWRLFGSFIVATLFSALVILGLALLFGGVGKGMGLAGAGSGAAPSPVALALAVAVAVLMMAAMLFVMLLLTSIVDGCYFESRIRNEGWTPPWSVAPQERWPFDPDSKDSLLPVRKSLWVTPAILLGLVGGAGYFVAQNMSSQIAVPMAGLGQKKLPVTAFKPVTQTALLEVVPEQKAATASTVSAHLARTAFFDKHDAPLVWVDVRISGATEGTRADVKVKNVFAADGSDIYAHDSPFEKMTQVYLSKNPEGLSGIRSINLKPGSTEDQLASADLALSLKVPTKTASASFSRIDLGRSKPLFDMQVTVDKIEGKKASLTVTGGHFERLLDYRGFLGGEPVERSSRSSWGSDKQIKINLDFRQDVDEVELVATRAFVDLKRDVHLDMAQKDKVRDISFKELVSDNMQAGAAATDALYDRANALYQKGDYQAAIPLVSRFLQQHPEHAQAWNLRAWSYWRLGQRDAAYDDVEKACDLGYKPSCALRRSEARQASIIR